MHGDLDLCAKRKGHWSIMRIYPASKRSDALKDAKHLKLEGLYEAIILADDTSQEILFSYTMKGEKNLRYNALKKALKASSEKRMVSQSNAVLQNLHQNQENQHTTVQTNHKAKQDKADAAALRTGLGGFLFTLITIAILSSGGASAPTVISFLLIMGGITIGATLWVYSLYSGSPQSSRKEAEQQFHSKKQLYKSKKAFESAFYLGKAATWDDKKQKFKGDGHFALILYMLGMSQGFKETQSLPHNMTQKQIANLFFDAGIAPQSITNCAQNLSEYLAYPKYHSVYQKGLNDVYDLEKNPNHNINLKDLFAAWYGQPQKQQAQALPPEEEANTALQEPVVPESNFALIMFTDIVGSTESIRRNGKPWMIDVLQAHNSIVREAISVFNGHEVKHTGDGIMMSFSNVENGLKASIAIQKGVALFNQKAPHRTFPLRIGMSAGEPMHLDGDLFGLPVNLAARVLPFAKAHEIALSQECFNLCTGLPYQFESKQDCTFKGFDDPQTIYFLKWEKEKTPSA